MNGPRPLVPIFVGLSLLSSVSAPEASFMITAFALALFGWELWLFCNAVAWWTSWETVYPAVSFARDALQTAGLGAQNAWILASVATMGGLIVGILVPSFVVSRFVARKLMARLPRLK